MDYRVLGSLTVTEHGEPVRLGGPKERAVLARLLHDVNETVSTPALVDAVWGPVAPRTAERTLQAYVARLRRSLDPHRPGGSSEVIVSMPGGYRLCLPADDVDVAVFTTLAVAGRRLLGTDPAAAAAALDVALDQWGGEPFAGLNGAAWVADEQERLHELRRAAQEDHVDALLQLGGGPQLVVELEALVRQSPLRERRWAQLMVALYQAGRQADALDAYQRARAVLADELGVDPGEELRRVQAGILAQAPELARPHSSGGEQLRQLPEALVPTCPMTGRDDDLAWLVDRWEAAGAGRGGGLLVAGPAGIGKTRLVQELAVLADGGGDLVLHAAGAAPVAQLARATTGTDVRALAVMRAYLSRLGPERAVLVILDGIDTLDAATVDLLRHAPVHVLVVGCTRAGEAPGGAPEVPLRALRPLAAEDAAHIVASYVADGDVAEAVAAVVPPARGLPAKVHERAGAWARRRARARIGEGSRHLAAERAAVRTTEERLAADVARHRRLAGVAAQVAGNTGPYRGLAPYEADDAVFFCGRDRAVAELVARLVAIPLVAVVGPSGSGKSSLVRAGMLPALASGALPGSAAWTTALLRPGEDPMAALGTVADGTRLLVVDQFEEVFTACADPDMREAFVDALLRRADPARDHATVVVCVRADYYGRFAAYPRLAGLLSRGHLLLGPMSPDELRQAITLPAARAAAQVEEPLVDALVDAVARRPGALPLLSTTLWTLWQRRQSQALRLDDYLRTGGVQAAVARLAEDAWAALDAEGQQTARRVLLRLVGLGEGTAAVRRRAPRAELAALPGDVDAVLEHLTGRRLLTADEGWVEVAHEALIREWPRLASWLDEDADGRALQRHLIAAAAEWERGGRDPAELYRGARLTGALDWSAGRRDELTVGEQAFLAASAAAAEEEVARARRTNRRLRALLAGVVALLLVAVAGGGVAALQGRRAAQEAVAADARRLGAQALTEQDLDRSLLLAVESVMLDDSPDTRAALLASLLRAPAALHVARVGEDRPSGLVVTPDGVLVVVADAGTTVRDAELWRDGALTLWDPSAREVVGELRLPEGQWSDFVAVSPDGRHVATAQEDGQALVVWDLHAREVSHRAPARGRLAAAAFNREGSEVALGTHEGEVARVDPATGARIGEPFQATAGGRLYSLSYTFDGRQLLTTDDEQTVLWDLETGTPAVVLPIASRAAALSPDGQITAIGGTDGTVYLWDPARGDPREVGRHEAAVRTLTFSADGSLLATGGDDQAVKVWGVSARRERETLTGHSGSVVGAGFSPDATTLYTTGLDGALVTWDVAGQRRLGRTLAVDADGLHPRGLAVAPGGRLLALSHSSGLVELWDLDTGRRAGRGLDGHDGPAVSAFSPDGRQLATAGFDGRLLLWDVGTGRQVDAPLAEHLGRIESVAWPAPGTIVTGAADGKVRLWDPAARRSLRAPLVHGAPVFALAVSPDGARVAAATEAGHVSLWELDAGDPVLSVAADRSTALAVAYAPDGTLLATGGSDGIVRLWDPETGRQFGADLQPHPGWVTTVAFSPDGTLLASSGSGGVTHLWDVRTRTLYGAFAGPPNRAVGARFSGERTLVTAAESGSAVVWDADPARWDEWACRLAGRALTEAEWAEALPGRSYAPACR